MRIIVQVPTIFYLYFWFLVVLNVFVGPHVNSFQVYAQRGGGSHQPIAPITWINQPYVALRPTLGAGVEGEG